MKLWKRHKACWFNFFLFKLRSNWRRKWQPTAVFMPGKFHGQRRLTGYSLWGHKESNSLVTKQQGVTTAEDVCIYEKVWKTHHMHACPLSFSLTAPGTPWTAESVSGMKTMCYQKHDCFLLLPMLSAQSVRSRDLCIVLSVAQLFCDKSQKHMIKQLYQIPSMLDGTAVCPHWNQ